MSKRPEIDVFMFTLFKLIIKCKPIFIQTCLDPDFYPDNFSDFWPFFDKKVVFFLNKDLNKKSVPNILLSKLWRIFKKNLNKIGHKSRDEFRFKVDSSNFIIKKRKSQNFSWGMHIFSNFFFLKYFSVDKLTNKKNFG